MVYVLCAFKQKKTGTYGIPEIDEFVLHNLERRKQVLQEEATESNTKSVMKQLSGDQEVAGLK